LERTLLVAEPILAFAYALFLLGVLLLFVG